MKKSILAVLAIVALSFASCGDPEPTSNPGECTIVHEGMTYVGPCDEIQRIIESYENPSIQ